MERQRRRTLEQNIAEEKDKVRKWETRLSEQRSTREYAALAREIDIAKKANITWPRSWWSSARIAGPAREVVKAKEPAVRAQVGESAGS